MTADVLKIEMEFEVCCICGGAGDLVTPEEYDAGAPPMQAPLRSMLLHLNSNRIVPEGKLCLQCAKRTVESYDFSISLSTRDAPPLSEKIRALRRKLYELTQKIDVFIVVGGSNSSTSGQAIYSEEDIIMVEKDALAAATAADDEDMERARNARGDAVYQCSVCPLSFQRLSEYRSHMATHPTDATHSCWICGAQFATREALRDHGEHHAADQLTKCNLCDTSFQCQSVLRRHESQCPSRCPACGVVCSDRAELSSHVAASHGRGATSTPHVCPVCFLTLNETDLFTAHLLRHRQAKQFVCGYDGCILRFATRSNLMAHIRKSHAEADGSADAETEVEGSAEEATAAPAGSSVARSKRGVQRYPCPRCRRTFASAPALKRHSRVHADEEDEEEEGEGEEEQNTEEIQREEEVSMDQDTYLTIYEDETEVEYLEVETLDPEFQEEEEEVLLNK